MNKETRESKIQTGLLVFAALIIASLQTAYFPRFNVSWLSWSEIDAIAEEKSEKIDFTTCRQDEKAPRGEVHVVESNPTSPNAILGKAFSFYPLVESGEGRRTDSMTVRWSVVTPVESQVSIDPVYADNFQLSPDAEGIYKVRMAIFRGNQLCDFKEKKIEVKSPKAGDRKRIYLAKRRSRMTA